MQVGKRHVPLNEPVLVTFQNRAKSTIKWGATVLFAALGTLCLASVEMAIYAWRVRSPNALIGINPLSIRTSICAMIFYLFDYRQRLN